MNPAPSRAEGLRNTLGTPGLLLGLLSLLTLSFGLAILAREYDRLRRTGREALRPVLADWVRTVPVHFLGWTIVDYADRWRKATDRAAAQRQLGDALTRLGDLLDRPEFRQSQLVEFVELDLGPPGGPPLVGWKPRGGREPGDSDLIDRIVALPAEGADPPLLLTLRYRVAPEIERAGRSLEASYRRLALAVAGLSLFPLLCLIYMLLQARNLRERAAREAAQAATLDLADRTCHELGNVAFVLANERRNLSDHLDGVERFIEQEPGAIEAAIRRAGLDEAQAERFRKSLRREYAERGVDPVVELAGGLELARDVCRQVAVCSDYIALTVRELDNYLKQSALPVQPAPTALDGPLDDAVALLGPRLGSGQVALERPLNAAETMVMADRRLLVHALVNLLKNALEATTTSDRPPRLRLGIERDGPLVWIIVADNGPGIAPEALPMLFQGGYSTKGAGRGRGLAVVRESILAQGGRLDVRSRPGEGAEFRIGLPAAKLPEEPMNPPAADVPGPVLEPAASETPEPRP
jgi:signal transduction histidine kinase